MAKKNDAQPETQPAPTVAVHAVSTPAPAPDAPTAADLDEAVAYAAQLQAQIDELRAENARLREGGPPKTTPPPTVVWVARYRGSCVTEHRATVLEALPGKRLRVRLVGGREDLVVEPHDANLPPSRDRDGWFALPGDSDPLALLGAGLERIQ